MGKTAFIYHPDYVLHDTGNFHPETSLRAKFIFEHMKSSRSVEFLDFKKPKAAATQWVEKIHAPDHLRFVEDACAQGKKIVDRGDTRCCPDSYRIALLAAGGALAAVDAVLRDNYRNAFSCARPPGHHARRGAAMGFCFFNNVAIAARYAQSEYGLKRILIVDWDVHHGNGTQESFYSDSTVLFFSTHQYPYYPGSGAAEESGLDLGEGYTINVPMAIGADIREYRKAFDEVLQPAAERFQPEIILLSAGFDAHSDDPLAGINLHDRDFAELTKKLVALADKHCEGRIVSILEGGYNLRALARSVELHLSVLGNA